MLHSSMFTVMYICSMHLYNPGSQINHTTQQIEYIEKYAGIKSDVDIAKFIGLGTHQVTYYRNNVLKVNSQAWRKPTLDDDNGSIESELIALLQYHAAYNGCMMESLEHRIKELSRKVR